MTFLKIKFIDVCFFCKLNVNHLCEVCLYITNLYVACYLQLELVRSLVAHGDAREGKRRGKWPMEWVGSTLTPPPNVVYPALLKLMRTPRLPAVD